LGDEPARMKSGQVFVGLWTIVAVCIVFAGCNPNSYGGGGGNPTPTPPIPAGDYYVNSGQMPNQVYAFSTAPIASNGQPSGLTNQPYSTGKPGQTGAQFGMAFAQSNAVLYVSNFDDNSIAIFQVNPADGSLGAATTQAVGAGPSGICVDPASNFLVAVNAAANTVQSFKIGGAGALTLVTTTPTTKLTSPVACAFSTDSTALYVTNNANPGGVTSYTVSGGGTLTLVQNWPLANDNFQGIVATSGAVFASTQGGNGVGAFLTAPNGNLVPSAVTPTAFGPIGLALSPNGKYLYVAAAAKQAVDAYAINGEALTQLPGAPYQVLTNGLSYVSVNSAGTLLVALDVVDHAVTPFAITSTGTLGFPPQAEYVYGAAGSPKAIVAR
jgi:6-phosphogluconolactonase (cycloisomerase 2 family)